ncbi:MAG: hypothetical protein HC908_14250 [Calothrix sp. SM1_7_51]|nr:hypothetical protein [Calothrix sp. SM1_7_51]
MLKSYTFGLFAAAALMIAPSAAFAGQTAVSNQNQDQTTYVSGENNTVVQEGTQSNRQNQLNQSGRGRGRYNSCRRGSSPQTAVSEQSQRQRADVSGYDNTVAQVGNQRSSQRQSNSCR